MSRALPLCACGRPAIWEREPPRPEDAPEHAVCLLSDAEFADPYCDACFPKNVPPHERFLWRRILDENSEPGV